MVAEGKQMNTRLFLKGNCWYFIGQRYQGASKDLYKLLMAALAAGEMVK
jgi:hypothetical protein